ncbi:MAG: alpha-ketoglutarate-dependent dioxygenase AlkB [Bacteroidota bacterium]|nr:alpha-ketoglutarate-dependent dioxygenase AlkB [Bacteroidota bacterium]MEC8568912.1 alpha-ketoglutarate-dependent dioxygenase AlkB [Pseudomonadota bacterium]
MENLDLFASECQEEPILPDIQGLQYHESFISASEEESLLKKIDDECWINDLERRVQHYGYKYDYKKKGIDYAYKAPPLPAWVDFLINRLQEKLELSQRPNQLIVNEYQVGQGISKHIDSPAAFGDTVVMVSLGSSCVMEFTKSALKEVLLLERCSVLMVTGEARYEWTHAIPARKTDTVGHKKYERTRRVSLTFRYHSPEQGG